MARYMTEDDLMRELEIDDWRHMTKDKVVHFASNLHKLDPEVAKKALEQFPNFTSFATGMVNHYKDVIMQVLNNNEKGASAYYSICNGIIESLKEVLKQDELTFEQKQYVISDMIQLSNNVADMHREDQKNGLKIIGMVGTVLLGAIVVIAKLFGGSSDDGDFDA